MKRYRQYGPLDDIPEVFGDVQFERLDMKSDPATLPTGAVQVSENLRFDVNGARVRAGIRRQFPADTNLGAILHAGIYKPPGEEDQFALVTARKLWLFQPSDQSLKSYPFPTGEVFEASDAIDVIQGNIGADSTLPLLTILHGLDQNVLSFDGTVVTVAPAIPRSEFGLYYQNRLAVNSGLQTLSLSDFLDFGVWFQLNQFQIELGGADYLVGLMAYQSDYVLIGCRKKWFVAFFDPNLITEGYSGGLQNSSFLRLLTNETGPLGREAMLAAMGLIWFVSDLGIYAFQPNLNNELVPLGRALSAEISPVLARLNATAAAGACIQQFGYRIYFALPISDVPVAIVAISLVEETMSGVTLPQTLPFLLSEGALATVTTGTPHGVSQGERVELTGLAMDMNGQWTVLSVPDEHTYLVAVPTSQEVLVGSQAMSQRLAARNNVVAVLNTNNRDSAHPVGMWESIDLLPNGFYADWLRLANYGAQRRLWVVDAAKGPCLYEEGAVDEVGDVQGGIALPFTLPITLGTVNFASVPVAGRMVSRAYRWEGMLGSPHGTIAYQRRIRASEARLTLNADDAGNLITRLRIPGRPVAEETVAFSGASGPDQTVATRLWGRALEAEMEFRSTAGNPTLRALEVQVLKSGFY